MRAFGRTGLAIVSTLALVYGWGGCLGLYVLGGMRVGGPDPGRTGLIFFGVGSIALVVVVALLVSDARRRSQLRATADSSVAPVRWEAVPDRDTKALLRPRALAARAAGGFVFGALFGALTFPWYGPLTLRSVAAGLVAAGTFGAVLGVIVPVAASKARTSSLSLVVVHGLAALAGGVAGAAWWAIATTDAAFAFCAACGAVVGMFAIHG